jgi:hypothetical protein
MNVEAASSLITTQLSRMAAQYGRPVFDEWALLAVGASGARVLAYTGPRGEGFSKTFVDDTAPLRRATAAKQYAVGDFDFALEAAGPHFDAMLRTGPVSYLVCNHTGKSMEEVRRDPLWLKAQAAWFDLAEAFRSDPLE